MPSLKTSEQEMVLNVLSEYDDAMMVDTRNRNRSFRNWRHYFGVDGGQYDDSALAALNNEDRSAAQFNIIEPKIDTLAGSLSSELWDVDYKPVQGKRNTLTEAVVDSWYSDKDLCHYEKHIANVIRNALVYRGDLKMIPSKFYDPMGNIAFVEVQPGYLIRDPYWTTDDDRDCEKAWEVFHLTAKQVQEKYDIDTAEIAHQIKMDKLTGGQYEDFDIDFSANLMMGIKGHLFRVIEYHWMDNIRTNRIVGKRADSERYVIFPITDDDAKREEFMIRNKIDPFTMRPTPYTDRVHNIAAVSPELTKKMLLPGKVSRIQPGRLPYFHLSSNRFSGVDKGMVDNLIDLQQTINKREGKITDRINTAGGGGKLLSNEVWDNDVKQADAMANINNPAYKMFTDPENIGKSVEYLNQQTFDSNMVDQVARMYDVVDRISKVPAAMDAMSESANESGVLFDRKLQVSRMGLITLINRLKNMRIGIGEAYFNQWQLFYNGPEREMASFNGKHKTVLNKRVYRDGQTYIQNRPDMVPRCAVIVTESEASPTRQMSERALYSDLFDRAVQTNPEIASIFFKKLMSTMPLSDKEEAEVEAFAQLQKIRDTKRIITELGTLDATEKQAALAAQQAILGLEQIEKGMPQQQLPQQEVPESEIVEQAEPVPETPQQEEEQTEQLLTV